MYIYAIKLHVNIILLHVDIKMSYVVMNKFHVNIITGMLHIKLT